MSRIGKQAIKLQNGITVEVKNNLVTVKGPKGELKHQFKPNLTIEVKEDIVTVTRPDDSAENRSLHGLTRTLIANMVEGVSKGFKKKLEIVGVGYKAQAAKNKITLNLGFSHPIEYIADNDITFEIDKDNKNIIIVSGINKEKVGQAAAVVRSYRKPEPYKGKGIKYIDEYIIRKAGKAAGA